MDNQMNIFESAEDISGIQREYDFVQNILPTLQEVAQTRNANPDDILSAKLSSYSSIYFRKSLIARIKLRGKTHYISIPKRLSDAIPDDVETQETRELNFLRIPYDSLSTYDLACILNDATALAIELVPKEFDCCSRYMECSNAKVCTHPDPSFSMLCGYRHILKEGKIFYGENRNID